MYSIQYFGYETSTGNFTTLTEARKELNASKREEKAKCRARYKTAKVTSTKDTYKIEFGCNLYSAASIICTGPNVKYITHICEQQEE
jgi:hypothetical protein